MLKLILECFGIDGVARAKLRRLFPLVPGGALISYLVLWLAEGAMRAVRALAYTIMVLAAIELVLGLYGKLAGLITVPLVKFSDMSDAGQKLLLLFTAITFVGIGMCIGFVLYQAIALMTGHP